MRELSNFVDCDHINVITSNQDTAIVLRIKYIHTTCTLKSVIKKIEEIYMYIDEPKD
jgi:hypothetical protein